MKTTNLTPNRATLDTRVMRASSVDLARAAVRYNLTDAVAAGEIDAGLALGLALAHAELPATTSDITDADIDALLAGVGQ